MDSTNKAALIILDGWGIGKKREVDAIQMAKTPYFDKLKSEYFSTELTTFGQDVGLPDGQMGNSEVGHLNIGAGRVVYQDLAKINKSIEEGTLETNPALIEAIKYASLNNKPIHLLGLLSDGGVHSHIRHLKALTTIINNQNVQGYIHAFTDGRDTSPKNGKKYVLELLNHIDNYSIELSSVIGRYFAMDRDNRWERIAKAYHLLVKGVGELSNNIVETISKEYEKDISDEFMPAIKCDLNGKGLIEEGDVVLFFNYRTDRPRELTKALTQESFPDQDMVKMDLKFYTMTMYDESFKGLHVLFNKAKLKNTFGEYVSSLGLTQIRAAETEKYPHVTFFFSGGEEKEYLGETRIMANSPKVATYDLKPEMSAHELNAKLIEEVKQNKQDFICLNFANPDMVGHTGDLDAAIKAVETVDDCLSELIPFLLSLEYEILIIADHGNADIMIKDNGSPHTAHTTNPVPLIYVSNRNTYTRIDSGKLADIAPTLCKLMKIDQPVEFTGINLLK